MKIGSKLEKLRERAGYTRAQVKDMLEIGLSTIGGWETDTREPSFAILDKLAGLYGTTVPEIFTTSNIKDSSPVIENEAKIDFLDKIILNLHEEESLGNGKNIEDLDDASRQILLGALNKHIQKVIQK